VPTYEFRCPNGHDFERFFKTMSAAPVEVECPDCGATAGRQLSAGAGLHFKGSGFYLTDYGKNAHRTAGPEKKGESGKAEGGAAGKGAAETGAGGKSGAKPEAAPKSETPKPAPPKPNTE
jgi:putative FmdB family regulatory protein